MRRTSKLVQELRQAGAKPNEIAALAEVAARLSQLKAMSASLEENRFARPLRKGNLVAQSRRRPLPRALQELQFSHRAWFLTPFVAAAVMCFAVCTGFIFVSQSAAYGSVLYPVQSAADAAAMFFRPSYRSSVMVKRMSQVDSLVAENASQGKVLGALADYRRAAGTYQSSTANYSVLEFCHDNLLQDAAHTTGKVHTAVEQALSDLGARAS